MASISRTIREQVTEHIRDEVVAGKFAAGEPLRESELAERFGVSRGPVRDAFLQLAQEGFLAYAANRGVTVRNPPDSQNRELIVSLRQQLEIAVLKNGMGKLTEGNWSRIESALTELEDACAKQDVAVIARSDMAFHEAILLGCGGTDLIQIWRLLCSQMLFAYSRLDKYDQVYQEHAEIFACLRAGKKQALVRALKANIR